MSIAISARIQDSTFKEAEQVWSSMHMSRNAYLNKAMELANRHYQSRIIREKLRHESLNTREDSRAILSDFENLL